MSKRFYYGMRLRGFSIGTAPTKGIIERQDDKSGRYWDILVYSRKLSETEAKDYELDYIGEE